MTDFRVYLIQPGIDYIVIKADSYKISDFGFLQFTNNDKVIANVASDKWYAIVKEGHNG